MSATNQSTITTCQATATTTSKRNCQRPDRRCGSVTELCVVDKHFDFLLAYLWSVREVEWPQCRAGAHRRLLHATSFSRLEMDIQRILVYLRIVVHGILRQRTSVRAVFFASTQEITAVDRFKLK